MKIVICNGRHSADYLIKQFRKNKNTELIIINDNIETAKYISQENNIDVYVGDATKEYVLSENNIDNCNLFVALSRSDTDNYVACQLAKTVYNAQKCICRAVNPKNVDLFKRLGIDIVVSSTYLLGETVKSLISVSNLVKSLAIEDEKIVLSEIVLKGTDFICNKQLKDINFPATGSISCIFRNPNVIIPKGDTKLVPGDKLLVISNPKSQLSILEFIQNGTNKE